MYNTNLQPQTKHLKSRARRARQTPLRLNDIHHTTQRIYERIVRVSHRWRRHTAAPWDGSHATRGVILSRHQFHPTIPRIAHTHAHRRRKRRRNTIIKPTRAHSGAIAHPSARH
jgi:hypothetical protein